ncbi:acyl carrier protein [Rubrivivax sp. RP6-9]|uniref:acyl carrier protein n=1 Tax=Rubrivivax sp. RP6-9 TaxID=3415750 RepID=UPI003CC6A9FD
MSNLTTHEVELTIKKMVRDLCPGDASQMADTSRLAEDLGYHSLALVELAFAIEDRFDIEPIDQGTAQSIRTVADVVGYVQSKVAANATEQEFTK